MALENIFPNTLINTAKVVSRDSKIYEAFKPYLSGILGIELEAYMSNKELRNDYRQKYMVIKNSFQEREKRLLPMKDEECLAKIATSAIEWQEFISTAKENTLDEGESFISSTPLDKYVLMTAREKAALENKLVAAALERVRFYTEGFGSSNTELNSMLNDNNATEEQVSHII